MYRSLLKLAIVAVIALAACASTTFHAVAHAVTYARDAASSWLGEKVAAIATSGQAAERKPTVLRVAARSFVARLVKRETPRVEASWRMCPST
jgi:IS4 transposase